MLDDFQECATRVDPNLIEIPSADERRERLQRAIQYHSDRCRTVLGHCQETLSSSTAKEAPFSAAGQYRFLRLIATGGCGDVSLAKGDRFFSRPVAIKTTKKDHAQKQAYQDRLDIESSLLASLEHPSIVSFHEKGETTDGSPFFAMEYLHGGTMSDGIDHFHRGRFWTVRGKQNYFHNLLVQLLQVSKAIGWVHASRQVLHNDLKPSNFMSRINAKPYRSGVVIDFGMASPAKKLNNIFLGTPAYAAPESAHGDEISERTEVFALGASLYHIITGRPPYQARSLNELLFQAIHAQFEPASNAKNDLAGKPLLKVCATAMHENPGSRFPNCLVFHDQLQDAMRQCA